MLNILLARMLSGVVLSRYQPRKNCVRLFWPVCTCHTRTWVTRSAILSSHSLSTPSQHRAYRAVTHDATAVSASGRVVCVWLMRTVRGCCAWTRTLATSPRTARGCCAWTRTLATSPRCFAISKLTLRRSSLWRFPRLIRVTFAEINENFLSFPLSDSRDAIRDTSVCLHAFAISLINIAASYRGELQGHGCLSGRGRGGGTLILSQWQTKATLGPWLLFGR